METRTFLQQEGGKQGRLTKRGWLGYDTSAATALPPGQATEQQPNMTEHAQFPAMCEGSSRL